MERAVRDLWSHKGGYKPRGTNNTEGKHGDVRTPEGRSKGVRDET